MTQESYTVKPGDTLSGIFGNAWRHIAALNHDVIGGNPDLIYPGDVLRLHFGAVAAKSPDRLLLEKVRRRRAWG